jgi:hypothetical protein
MHHIRVLSTIFFSCFLLFSQATTVFDKPSNPATVASPSFTAPLQYNSYDFCGSPLGLFDRDSLRLRIGLGTQVIRWHASNNSDSLLSSYTAWNAPNLIIGAPDIFYARLYYTPTTIGSDFPGLLGMQHTTLPLQAFGLTMAGQIPSGLIQFAFQGKGYLGEDNTEGNQNSRMYMGFEDLSLTLGSRVHELIALGMMGGATAQFDSLRDYSILPSTDRCFSGQIPRLGWYIDFGNEDFPMQSEFSLASATHRFVYVSLLNIDQDPIKGDSIAWKWQTTGDVKVNQCAIRPALLLGYWRNHYQRYTPTESNDNLNVGPVREGRDWTFSDFQFGIGLNADLFSIASPWIEYTHASMGLDYGSAWTGQTDKNQVYHCTNVGIEANLHTIEALRIPSSAQVFLRVGYFNVTYNSGIDPFQSREFGIILPSTTATRIFRYLPDFGWGRVERVRGLVIGLGSSILDGKIELDSHLGFLANERNGFAFGMQIAYALRK